MCICGIWSIGHDSDTPTAEGSADFECATSFDDDRLRFQRLMHLFMKDDLNRVFTLPDYSRGSEFMKSSRIIGLQNANKMLVAKH